jgi:hypothetical protein
MQQTPQHLCHARAPRLLRAHGLADQVQLLSLPGTEIHSAACAMKQSQQEIAPAAQFPRAATGEVENHCVGN